MHVRFHAVCVKSPLFPILHVTMKVVTTCLACNPHLLILKLHKRSWRSPRSFGKIRDNLIKVRVGPLVRVTSTKFWMKLEDRSHNGSVENCPPVCENLVHLPTRTERKDPWLGIVWQVMLMHERKTRRTIEGGDNYPPAYRYCNARPWRQAATPWHTPWWKPRTFCPPWDCRCPPTVTDDSSVTIILWQYKVLMGYETN